MAAPIAKLPPEVDLIALPEIVDGRGRLIVAEQDRAFPFAAARCFVITDVPPGETRGAHAHWELLQFLVVLRGSCHVSVETATGAGAIELSSPSAGLLLRPLVWTVLTPTSSDCLLMVLASAPYDEADYIRDYAAFREAVAS